MKHYRNTIMAVSLAALLVPALRAHAGEEHSAGAAKPQAAEMMTVKGEVLDMACYIDHGASGEKHAACAKTCIESGLPVGIKGQDGKTYLLVGEHKPMNQALAPFAAKTITVRGKFVSRDGFNMLENAEIVK